jgi:hypothetical protein
MFCQTNFENLSWYIICLKKINIANFGLTNFLTTGNKRACKYKLGLVVKFLIKNTWKKLEGFCHFLVGFAELFLLLIERAGTLHAVST